MNNTFKQTDESKAKAFPEFTERKQSKRIANEVKNLKNEDYKKLLEDVIDFKNVYSATSKTNTQNKDILIFIKDKPIVIYIRKGGWKNSILQMFKYDEANEKPKKLLDISIRDDIFESLIAILNLVKASEYGKDSLILDSKTSLAIKRMLDENGIDKGMSIDEIIDRLKDDIEILSDEDRLKKYVKDKYRGYYSNGTLQLLDSNDMIIKILIDPNDSSQYAFEDSLSLLKFIRSKNINEISYSMYKNSPFVYLYNDVLFSIDC